MTDIAMINPFDRGVGKLAIYGPRTMSIKDKIKKLHDIEKEKKDIRKKADTLDQKNKMIDYYNSQLDKHPDKYKGLTVKKKKKRRSNDN